MKFVAAILVLLVSLSTTVALGQTPDGHNQIEIQGRFSGSPSSQGESRLRPGSVQNVVVIFQENRSPDNLFGSNPNFLPGVDIATVGVNSKGQQIPLTPIPLDNNYDLEHAHRDFVHEYDKGKMDGADKVIVGCENPFDVCPPENPQFKYVDNSAGILNPYFDLAEQYAFGDRMFQTDQGPSFSSHQFIIAGTSAPTEDSDLFASENPEGANDAFGDTGCTAPATEWVSMIDPTGSEATRLYPCFEHQTLPDLLDNAGLSWRYYTPRRNNIWTGPNAIHHLRLGPDWQNVVENPAQVLSDIAGGKLANVSWVIPSGQESDHPGGNAGLGPSWVASIVNAIGQSQYWDNAVILITWDEWGGWYDHVAPKVINSYEYGFRVPLIVVSPFAKQAYVSHVTHDFGSILHFIEEAYGLPSLGFADALADDLSDCFDFRQHNRFSKIKAPYDANYFLNDKTPPQDPDNDDDPNYFSNHKTPPGDPDDD